MLTPANSKLSLLEKIGFGSGDAAVNIVWSALAIIITFFYTDVYRLKVEDLVLLGLLPRLIDAFADVAMGIFTDGRTTRWGRYRPYLFVFAVPFGLSVMLTFTTPDLPYMGKLIWAYTTYTLMMVIFTTVTIPYISLPGVITDDPKERLSANGYRLFFAKGASLMVNIFVPIFAARWGQEHLAQGYHVAMMVMAGLATLIFFFCFFTTKERVQHKTKPMPVIEQVKLLFANSQWQLLFWACIIGTTGYIIRGSLGFYYAKYYLGGDANLLATFVAVGIVGNILAMVASTWLTKVFCKVQVFRWSQIITFILCVVMYFAVGPHDVMPAMVLYFLINLIVDLQGPVFWSVISEAVDYGQVKTGKRVAGLAFGGISFAQKAGMGIGAGVVALLLLVFHYQPDVVQSQYTLNGIALSLTVVSGVFQLGMGLLMYGYFITDKYYNQNIRQQVTEQTP
jgi:GPH family glycoside/pentoside/hexuronide:cation symporter